MNNYHRFIKCEIDPKLDLNYVLEKREEADDIRSRVFIEIDPEKINPEIFIFLDKFNVKVKMCQVLHCSGNEKIHIHADDQKLSNLTKMNWTWGSPESELRWWEIDDENKLYACQTPEPLRKVIGDNYLCASEQDCKLVFSQKITKPSLVNAGFLHSVYNPSPQRRITLSLLIEKNGKPIDFSDSLKIFEKVLE